MSNNGQPSPKASRTSGMPPHAKRFPAFSPREMKRPYHDQDRTSSIELMPVEKWASPYRAWGEDLIVRALLRRRQASRCLGYLGTQVRSFSSL